MSDNLYISACSSELDVQQRHAGSPLPWLPGNAVEVCERTYIKHTCIISVAISIFSSFTFLAVKDSALFIKVCH